MHVPPVASAPLPAATVALLQQTTKQQLHEARTNIDEIRRQLPRVQVRHDQLANWSKILTYGAVGGSILLAGWIIVPWALGATAAATTTASTATPALCTAASCLKTAAPIIATAL